MREIKFRGKRVDNGQMWYGDLSHHKTGKIFIKNIDMGIRGTYEVDKNTVSQYTGLKDKNGVKIYEGDIVCTRFPKECQNAGKICSIGDIQFRDGVFGAEWTQWKNDTFWGIRRLDEGFYKYIEVIGNIYDNPELLGI